MTNKRQVGDVVMIPFEIYAITEHMEKGKQFTLRGTEKETRNFTICMKEEQLANFKKDEEEAIPVSFLKNFAERCSASDRVLVLDAIRKWEVMQLFKGDQKCGSF